MVQYLTGEREWGYSQPVVTQLTTGIDSLKLRALRRSLEALFLRPRFMVGCMGALSSAPTLGSVCQPRMACHLKTIDSVCGSSPIQTEDADMENLIPIASRFIAGTPTKTVNGRKLHCYLEVGRDFSNWIKGRIEQYGFEEGIDYIVTLAKTGERRNIKKTNYFVSLDMAKELAMVERTDKGREARRYFIECEKQIREPSPQKTLPAPPVKRQQLFVATVEGDRVGSMLPVSDDFMLISREELNALRRPFDYFNVVAPDAVAVFADIERRRGGVVGGDR